jgi:hypothetical protein
MYEIVHGFVRFTRHLLYTLQMDHVSHFELASSANVMLFRGGVGYDLTS